jgi:hypothetical protein
VTTARLGRPTGKQADGGQADGGEHDDDQHDPLRVRGQPRASGTDARVPPTSRAHGHVQRTGRVASSGRTE